MSLTSVELNYLVWRYLKESGFDLTAYALLKDSACLDYDHTQNKLISVIEPGCLVNLVQKGILYTFLEDSAAGKESLLNLLDAVLKDKIDYEDAKDTDLTQNTDSEEATKGVEAANDKTTDTIMKDALNLLDSDLNNGDMTEDEAGGVNLPFSTKMLSSFVTMSSCLLADWHPSTDVFALGNDDSTAVIHALGTDGIAETVALNHPPVVVEGSLVPSAISVVSWSPQGSMVLTAGAGGEIRAWAPDGRLKNVANSVAVSEQAPAIVQSVVWNATGLLLLSINNQNSLSVWEGSTLSLLLELHSTETTTPMESHACWLGELKFAMTTRKNSIKIFSVNVLLPREEVVSSVGQLIGHNTTITSLCFSPISKLLASASDIDYIIKVWNSLLTQDALELNNTSEKLPHLQYHTLPIILLKWLSLPGDVQGNELISVSMEGSVNIWDAFTGDAIVSANVFNNPDNYRFPEENEGLSISTGSSLVFASAVSPMSKYLAIGDDSGNVSIWDIRSHRYKGTSEFLRCLGMYTKDEMGESNNESKSGICDVEWDSKGHFLTVCYKGRNSVILKWEKE